MRFTAMMSFLGFSEESKSSDRKSSVSSRERMKGDWKEMHGHQGSEEWPAPFIAVRCDEEARPGYATKKAHEYIEDPETFKMKIKLLATMLRKSKNCIAYTGAGISTAVGIGDYASKAKDSVSGVGKKKVSAWDAQPTYAHRAMVALFEAGVLKHWIQQNHDGLPQKAGFPQEHINEIHGAWYDPSNPVVPMSGKLRGDLFEDLLNWEEKTDLTLAMGSSLCGMNADRVVVTPAKKALKGKGLGAVIVSLQQTQYDNLASLRFYAKIDDVMEALMKEMELAGSVKPMDAAYVPRIPEDSKLEEDVFSIPFDASGRPSTTEFLVLDLKVGSKVKLTGGCYESDVGIVRRKDAYGHYEIAFLHKNGDRVLYKFGSWWIDAALRGKGIVEPDGLFPLVNA